MKTYRVTVVRMVEGTAIVEANSKSEAKRKAALGGWVEVFDEQVVGHEVIGDVEEIESSIPLVVGEPEEVGGD